MKMNMDSFLETLQTQKLDPKLIMANTILQMSSLELEQKIDQEVLENPALEIEEKIPERKCPFCQIKSEKKICQNCGNVIPDKTVDEVSEDMMKREAYMDDIEYLSRSFIERYQEEDQGESWWTKVSSTQSLTEYLSVYLPLVIDDKDEYRIGIYMLSYINDDGYLSYNQEEIKEKFSVSKEKIEKIVQSIQSLEPVGVGARNIKECINIQLKNLKKPVPSLVWELLSDKYWNDFTHRRFTYLAESLQASIEQVRTSADFIKDNVNPYPGRDFDYSSIKTQTAKLKPDVIIRKNKDELEVELVDDNYKSFRINATYKNLYNDIKKNRNNYSVNEIDHTRNYFYRAKTFIENINQRKDTILKVTKKIVEIQYDFFYYGISHLKPLTRIQVAEAIGIHDSTVSRATKDKFVQLPCGKIVDFDFFFDSSLPIKEEIHAVIQIEKKSNPLSDKEIADILNKKGIKVARRTIAKYREEMHILSSRDRKYS